MAAKQSPVPQTIAGKRRRFLAVLADTANVSRAARDAGLASSTVYRMRAKNDKFRIGWDEAIASALDTLEAALLARAVNGVERPLVYGGKKIATVTTYSDPLGMFFLKTRRPEIYGAAATGDTANGAAPPNELAEVERRLDRIAARPAVDG